MRRREFVFALGLATLGMPLPARTQGSKPKRVGVLLQGGPYYSGVDGLREELKASGLQEGRELALIVRDGMGDLAAIGAAARALEHDGTDLIVAFATSVALAAQRATVDVPIVFAISSDPVALGLVNSMARPGGRLTGVHNINTDLTAKRLEILRELVPSLRRVLTFYNPGNASAVLSVRLARDAAQKLGVDLIERHFTSTEQIREHLHTLGAADADGYFFVSDAMVNSQDSLIIDRANALGMATMASWVDPVARGALVGYGASFRELGRDIAGYVTRILAGSLPRDLPVEAVTRPALALNLKTARALGLTIPPSILARADEVIE
jgi:putative tryptophan/tyrosine transport system substrate-binding protein